MAGNSPETSDQAVAALVISETRLPQLDLKPRSAGGRAFRNGMRTVQAIPRALTRAGIRLGRTV